MKVVISYALFAASILSCTDSGIGWQTVYETSIAPNCAASACHSEYSKVGGISLYNESVAFETLTGRPCSEDTKTASGLVNVDNPGESYLLLLLRRDGSTGMPPNRRLSDQEIDDFETWIAGGAKCD